MRDPSIAAFIPLKGHSARVPGKNLRLFGGRPLFHVIVETLQQATHVGEIFIDTDSDAIAASAADLADVSVVRRKPQLEGDDTSVNLLIADFLIEHPGVEYLLQTHATNPLLRATTVDRAIEALFDDPGATSLFSVTRHQARFYTSDLRPVNHDPTELRKTQDLEPVLEENSNLYIFERDAFFEHQRRITSQPLVWEMDALEAIDIDEEVDFTLAEIINTVGRGKDVPTG